MITFEEVTQTVINLVRENELLKLQVKQLEAQLAELQKKQD